MSQEPPIRVLFVCTGNICRSPMAEALFSHMVAQQRLADRLAIASAGTEHWNVGRPPHRGTLAILQQYGIPLIEGKTAAQVTPHDMASYDYVLAMEQFHVVDLRLLTPAPHGVVRRLMEFAPPGSRLDVPDPYYSGGFQEVYDMLTAGLHGFLEHLHQHEKLR
jgi:protein-tyrosine phosphatase